MSSLLKPAARQAIESRIASLTPTSPRGWGTLRIDQMLCHVSDQLRCALGELEVKPIRSPLSLPPLRWLAIHVVPWPKGTGTATEMLSTEPATFEADRQQLLLLLERFVAEIPDKTRVGHPLFGRLTPQNWGTLAYRHLDHHLKQFGC